MEETMKKMRFLFFFLPAVSVFFIPLNSHSQQSLSIEEIVNRNIQAAGGAEKISEVKNYSFSYDSLRNSICGDGRMKIIAGHGPVVTEVICVDKTHVKRNSFNIMSEFQGLVKSTYQALALLRSGVFSLANFKDNLILKGTKKFGSQQHFILSTDFDGLRIDFYIDPEDGRIKRIVFEGFEKETGNYQVNHDFGLYEEVESFWIPTSWFSSQVGGRGVLYEISDIRFNEDLPEDFFSSLEIKAGEVSISPGELYGNVVELRSQRNLFLIGTNWTEDSVRKAGFASGDKMVLFTEKKEIPLDFYDSDIPDDVMKPGAKIMMPAPRGENYLIYLWSQEFKSPSEEFELLQSIRVKKIQ